jgi:hypothetical protein
MKTSPYIQRVNEQLGMTIGLHEEQGAVQAQGMRIAFRAEERLPPSSDKAMQRLIKRHEKKMKMKNIKTER